MIRSWLIIFYTLGAGLWYSLQAQESLYDQATVQEIRIYFEEDDWDAILDDYYTNGEGERLTGQLSINGVELKDVGVRYKGYSSASVDRVKNPFNIDLDYVHADQEYNGYDKLKLSNVIHDPSFVREALSYEIARQYMPASQANFARVYVNDEYIGLYTNVESVDKGFLRQQFGSKYNAFIKCNPATVDLNGENSNLSNSPGTNPYDYQEFYTLKSNDSTHWEQLYHLIDTLNEYPDDIETILNVDRTLWMHALNYTLVNLDSYIGYAQNYYLYRTDDGRFQPILWDMNQSFGSYRLTDASDYWQGFSVYEAAILDPLAHYKSVSVYPRPLLRNLFENDTYRRMYLAHIRTIVQENFSDESYKAQASYLQSVIDEDVKADLNKFYDYSLFALNLDTAVTDLIDYPGIFSLMDARTAYLSTYPGIEGAPAISDVRPKEEVLDPGTDVWISATVKSASSVFLAYRFLHNGPFSYVTMLDDGTQEDAQAGDGIYGASIPSTANLIEYYVYAENDSAGRFSPERAAYEYYELNTEAEPGDLVINELMARNSFTIADESDDYDDWIELHNTRDFPLSLEGLFLSNNAEQEHLWALPNYTIPANGFVLIWADEDTAQGVLHANFKLDGGGGYIGLYSSAGEVIDSKTFDEQSITKSYGRYPSNNEWGFMWPSPNASNNESDPRLETQSLFIYPNPVSTETEAQIQFLRDTTFTIQLFTQSGQIVGEWDSEASTTYTLPVSNYQTGLYFIRAVGEEYWETQKLLIIQEP